MAKYSFKVYLEDNSSKVITPSIMINTDLHDMDKFVNECGLVKLYNIIANELDIPSYKIKKIKIIRNKKQIEFSLITNNQYLTSVLNNLHKEKIKSNRKYQREVIVVSNVNPSYIEMKDYLFSNLKKDYKFFLNEVYNYDNEFSELLNKYGIIHNYKIQSQENERELKYLETIISTELRVYKNYRGMCRSRKKYEENRITPVPTRKNVRINDYVYNNNQYRLTKEFPSVKELTQNYNEEFEEYLDEDEFASMTSQDELPKGYR